MEKSIKLYGWVKDITTHDFEVTKKHTFTLVTENGAEFFVQVLDNNLCYDLNTEDFFHVKGVEDEFGIVAGYVDRWGRFCSYCGKHHTEGYYIEGGCEYACSDDCLLGLYHGVYKDMERDIENEDTYWTEWE